MSRSSFLEIWKAYPEMPTGCEAWGRLESCADGKIALQKKGAWPIATEVFLGPLKDHDKPSLSLLQISEILKKDDQVSLRLRNGQVVEIFLLAPAIEIPIKTDTEILKKWAHFLGQVRHFFSNKGFLEVQTPTLVTCPGTEPFLDVFSTEFSFGSTKRRFFLPTSPEISLKKMLAAGTEQIFEMRPCFRNGEVSDRHLPEFWMLEWYRAYSNLEQIQQDALHLVQFLSGQEFPLRRISVAELFKRHLNFELTPQTSKQELLSLAKHQGLQAQDDWTWDEVFHLIFLEKVEGLIDSELPVFVDKYPPSQAALARLTEDGWGDRFELYWKGYELANAFHELNDPKLQRQRSQEDLDLKKQIGKPEIALDEEFFKALDSGMPPAGGIALGLERLFMVLNGVSDIQAIRRFSV